MCGAQSGVFGSCGARASKHPRIQRHYCVKIALENENGFVLLCRLVQLSKPEHMLP